jgi:hypothetical protein
MKIDTGLAIVIVAVLIFYLRLIIIQRERVRRVNPSSQASGKKKDKLAEKTMVDRYSILSHNKQDWIIVCVGLALVIFGILLNRKIIPDSLIQEYWWIPVSIGIIAFSWGFK